MNCPYCAEDIKDEAIVCCHCNRDLTFLQVFEKRISSLERSLKYGKSPAAPVSLETTQSWAEQQQVMRILVLLQGTVVTLIIYLFGLLYQHSLLQPSNWVTLIMLAAPLPFAVFLVSFPDLYRRTGEYVAIGLLQGVVMWFVAMARARIRWPDPILTLVKDRLDALVVYVLTAALLYLSVGLLRKSLRRSELSDQATDEQPGTRWEFIWKTVMPPLLTFIASMASLLVQAFTGHGIK